MSYGMADPSKSSINKSKKKSNAAPTNTFSGGGI
jgi:hypothetical protein